MMRTAGLTLALIYAGAAGAASAEAPATIEAAAASPLLAAVSVLVPVATVRMSTLPVFVASAYRLKAVVAPVEHSFRLNDPESMLQAGYAGMFDLFAFGGGNFRLSGGSRLWSRAGRWRSVEPESLRALQPFRYGSLRASRKFRPALLVGYGRTVDRGFSLGVDGGLVQGKIGTMPDRLGRLNRSRLEALGGRAMRPGMNGLARMTALYRF